MRQVIFLFYSLLFLFSCTPKTEIVETEDEFGNILKYTRDTEDFAREGEFTLSTPEGQLLEKATYVNDTLDGLRILFFENGDTATVEQYKMGKFEGPYSVFYENGQLELEGNYINNAMSGKWTRYYQSGKLMEEVNFENNEENGPFVEYYENGNLKAEGSYLDGDNEHGALKLYNENGELVREMDCKKGICRTTWSAEGEE